MGSVSRALCRWVVRTQLAPCLAAGVSIPRARRRIERSGRLALPLAGTRVEATRIAGRPAAWIRARGVPDDAEGVVLYLHGGGFATGSSRSYRGFASRLSRACAAPLLLPDYRRPPEHPYPAPDEDCLGAYRALLEAGHPSDRILLAGDSAGGFLTLQTLLAARDAALPLPRAAILLSPLTDARHFDGDSYIRRRDVDVFLDPDGIRYLAGLYAGASEPLGDALSPVRRDLSGLPPLLVQVGDHEILLSDAVRLVDRARECGVIASLSVWPEMWHVFQLFAVVDGDAARAVEQIGEFARKQLGAPAQLPTASAAGRPTAASGTREPVTSRRSGSGDRPTHRVELVPCDRPVQVRFNGAVVADSARPLRVLETNHDPVLYFPPKDVRFEHLERSEHASFCPFKGSACYWTLRVGERSAENAAWSYEDPLPEVSGLAGHVAFYADRVEWERGG